MKDYLIWYHKEDNDGLFSAAIIYNYLTHNLNINSEEIEMQGMTYAMFSDLFPNEDAVNFFVEHYQYKHIIMTDISCSDYKMMKALYKAYANNFIWIDHHKPIINLSKSHHFDKIEGIRDTNRSAILNAYHYLFDPFDEKYNNHDVPELFRLLSAYDSWSYEREHIKFDKCRNVNKGVTTFFELDLKKIIDYTAEVLYYDQSKIINTGAVKFIRQMHKLGKIYNDYDDAYFKSQIEIYGDFNWTVNGRKAVMIIYQGATGSQCFKSLQKTDYKVGIVLKPLKTGKCVLSLYNIKTKYDKEFQCGDYLNKNYKGGGHPGAGGATISMAQMLKIIKTKSI